MRKTTAAPAVAGALALVITTSQSAAADGHGKGWYGVGADGLGADGVNVRDINEGNCIHAPSTSNRPTVLGRIRSWEEVLVYCQIPGRPVGGNPYWLMVQPRGWTTYGIISSYYVENSTNRIDGVPGLNGCVIQDVSRRGTRILGKEAGPWEVR